MRNYSMELKYDVSHNYFHLSCAAYIKSLKHVMTSSGGEMKRTATTQSESGNVKITAHSCET